MSRQEDGVERKGDRVRGNISAFFFCCFSPKPLNACFGETAAFCPQILYVVKYLLLDSKRSRRYSYHLSASKESFGKMIWIEESSGIQISIFSQGRAACSLIQALLVETEEEKKKATRRILAQPIFPHMTFQLARHQESNNNTNIYEPISLGAQRRSHSMLLNISLVSPLPLSEGRFCAAAGLNSSASRAWRLERMLAFSSHVP